MQKKLIALALASLAGSAFAQSNVTVYGVVDVGQAWVKSSGGFGADQGSVGRLDNNNSYIGFKGVEDLGNGLKAVFQIETTVTADTAGAAAGAITGTGRDTYIGLAGGFGTVVAGNLTHPLRGMGLKAELIPGAAGFGTMAAVTGTVLGMKTGADDRAANAVAYISPSFSGFTAIGAYVNGEVKDAAGANARQYQIAGQYENGPIYAALGYHHDSDYGVTVTANPVLGALTGALGASNGDSATVWRAVGAYTFPTNTKVTALYDQTKADTNLGEAKRTAWSLGVGQGFGKHNVGIEYARSGKVKVDGDSVNETSYNMWTAVYSYELSKRTLVHARYSKLSNDDSVAANFYGSAAAVGNTVTPGGGSTISGFMVGLRHSF